MLVCMYTIMCSQCDCDLSLAGGDYICYRCGTYSDRLCACSVAFLQC